MINESTGDRLDYLEAEVIAAGDISGRLMMTREALGLIHGILEDLVNEREDSDAFAEDLERLETIGRFL